MVKGKTKLPVGCKTKITVYHKKEGRVVPCTGYKLRTCFPKKKPQKGITKAAKEACADRPKEYRKNCQKDYMSMARTKPRALKGQTTLLQYD